MRHPAVDWDKERRIDARSSFPRAGSDRPAQQWMTARSAIRAIRQTVGLFGPPIEQKLQLADGLPRSTAASFAQGCAWKVLCVITRSRYFSLRDILHGKIHLVLRHVVSSVLEY